jgi:4-amino-4-deoxy-L-arabinose transferase-like glycosyltransferase
MQIIFWTVLPALVNVAPPGDVVEGFMWGREWVLLTYKHPQLPAWLLETAHLLTGSFRWPQYLLSQLVVSSTFIFVYLLARDILGRKRALAAVLLMPSIYFFGWPTPQFNHDYAQMPFWAAICWLLWRSVTRNGPGWWLALGLVAGVGIYAKFSTGLLLAFGGLWLLYDARARSRLATPWPWLGLAVFLVVATPIAIALVRSDFLPLTYVVNRDSWVLQNRARLYYCGVQCSALVGFFAVLAISGLLRRGAAPKADPSAEPPIERSALGYVLWMGLGPAILVMIASLFAGIGEAWGAPMYNLAGVVAVALLGHRLGGREMRALMICAAACIVVMSSAYAGIRWSSCNLLGHMQPVCWPSQAISDEAEAYWHEKVHAPLGIVGGETGVAMVAGLKAYDKPSIFTDLDTQFAPWITPQRLQQQGLLMVWPGEDAPPAQIEAWVKNLPVKTVLFDWSLRAPPLAVSFVAIPPGTSDLPIAASSSQGK